MTITGTAAINTARALGLTLSKYNDPSESARDGLSVAEALEVAAEDPELIYLELDSTAEG